MCQGVLNHLIVSKGNMLLGHARGKVGDIVFSRVNGQQVTRARAAVVKNPQTEPQMIQRIILNTVIQAYARMAEITDHSFEGVAVGAKSMNKFLRENIVAIRQRVAAYASQYGSFDGIYAFTPKGMNSFVPNPWIVATGQLPEVVLDSVSPTDGAVIIITSAGAIPTYAELIGSLGLNRGDQLTFIGQELYTDARAAFKFARVILDPRNEDGTEAGLDAPFLVDGKVNLPSPRNEGAEISFSSAANSLTFDLGENSMFGAAVIVSRQKSDGSWMRSNTTIMLAEDIPYALVGAMDLRQALDYTAAGGIDLESERYLNNAVRGRKVIAPTPSPSPEPGPTPGPTPGDDPELTALSIDGQNLLNPNASVNAAGDLNYAGNNLVGCWLIMGDSAYTVGQQVSINDVPAGKKNYLNANSGTTTTLSATDTYQYLALFKDGEVVSVHGAWRFTD